MSMQKVMEGAIRTIWFIDQDDLFRWPRQTTACFISEGKLQPYWHGNGNSFLARADGSLVSEFAYFEEIEAIRKQIAVLEQERARYDRALENLHQMLAMREKQPEPAVKVTVHKKRSEPAVKVIAQNDAYDVL